MVRALESNVGLVEVERLNVVASGPKNSSVPAAVDTVPMPKCVGPGVSPPVGVGKFIADVLKATLLATVQPVDVKRSTNTRA